MGLAALFIPDWFKKRNMKVLVLLEFGIPPYRDFLFKYLKALPFIKKLTIVHTGQRFEEFNHDYDSFRVPTFDFYELTIHKGVLEHIKSHDIIISSFNINRPLCWLPMLLYRKPWILWGPGLGRNKWNFMNRLIRKPFIYRANKFIVYTEEAKKELVERWQVDEEKLSVAYNTLYVSNSENTSENREYLLYVGRLQQRKGIERVLYALYRLKQRKIILHFVILGDGEIKADLEKLVQDLGIEQQVTFRPATFDDAVLKKVFSSALAYVSPDHIGLGVVHSFAYGVPVMTCSNKEHAREFGYCSNDNSFLYEKDEQLDETIEKLASNPGDSYQKGKMGYEYYKEKLSHHHMEKVFLDAIEEAAKR